jgi:hypothetical protein
MGVSFRVAARKVHFDHSRQLRGTILFRSNTGSTQRWKNPHGDRDKKPKRFIGGNMNPRFAAPIPEKHQGPGLHADTTFFSFTHTFRKWQ